MNLKSWIPTLLKLAFAGGLIYWLVATDRFQISELRDFLTIQNILIGLMILSVHMIIITERWRQLLISQGIKLSVFQAWKLSHVGLFFSFAVPGGVGGDVMKAFLLQKDFHAKRSVAYSSALVDRLLGLYSFVIMALGGLFLEIQTQSLQIDLLGKLMNWLLILFFLLSIGILAVIKIHLPKDFEHQQGLRSKIYRFKQACRHYLIKPWLVTKCILITMAAQTVTICFFYWFFRFVMNQPADWPLLFFAVPLGFMLMAVPLTPAGIGIGQAAFFFLFDK
ncbi:MAG: lysylphosphatidylglycerol synthase transmembrane domain-containing protein, partial [Bdellovibrionales bacterium]